MITRLVLQKPGFLELKKKFYPGSHRKEQNARIIVKQVRNRENPNTIRSTKQREAIHTFKKKNPEY